MLYRTHVFILSSALILAFSACGGDESGDSESDGPGMSGADSDMSDDNGSDSDSRGATATDSDAEPASSVECSDIPIMGPQGYQVDATCESCIDERCCNERLQCSLNSQCAELRECFFACQGEGACESNCVTTIGGPNENRDFTVCRAESCGAECADRSCIGSVEWSTPTVTEYETNMQFLDFQSGDPVVGASIQVCDKHTDLDCESPLMETTTDSEGFAALTLPSADDGISVFIALDADGYLGSDFWFTATDPEAYLTEGDLSWNVVSNGTRNLISNILEVTGDETRGIVSFIATDCGRAGTAGVEVQADSADDDTTRFYLAGGFPNADSPTTASGGAGAFLNLPPGETQLTMTGPDGTLWGQVRVNLRANRTVGTNLVPTPL